MTAPQADLTERARAGYMQQALEIIHASNEWSGTPPPVPYREHLQRGIAAALQSEREAAAGAPRRAAIVVLIEQGKAGLWYAVSDDIPGLLVSAVTREELEKAIPDAIAALKAASASPAPQDDLEGDVKHGNAEYFRAALAHAAAEARKAALREAEIACGPETWAGFRIRALASPTPQEETR